MILLKCLSLGLQCGIVALIVRELRHPVYQFRRWTLAWAALLVASLLIASVCLASLIVPMPPWLAWLLLGVSLCKLAALWLFRAMFQVEVVLAHPTDAAWVEIDSFSMIVAWDAQAAKLLGWPPEDAIGQTLMQTMIPPRDWEAHREGMAKLLATGDEGRVIARTFAVNACRKNGTEIPVTIRVTSVPHADGTLHFLGQIRELGVL